MMGALCNAQIVGVLLIALTLLLLPSCNAFSSSPYKKQPALQLQTTTDIEDETSSSTSRRNFVALSTASLVGSSGMWLHPSEANAAPDCMKDCVKNCKLIAPKDPEYCQSSCQEYCAQTDRTDGLSGSVSSTGGEVGILGVNTVVKGDDKPPQIKIPGLDFTNDGGKKLIGY